MPDSPARRALLIGIDQYALQPDVVRPLAGCVNDVDAMERLLRAPPYEFQDVRVLRNAEATREAILGAFDALVEAAGPDDTVVIQYSGHGSQKWNASGDEASGWDSTIVPVDSGRKPVENRDITDKEIGARLEALGQKTPYATLLFDSCHSGTITRDAFEARSRGVVADVPAPGEVPNAAPPPRARGIGKRAAESGEAGSRYVVISGCRDEETSWEYQTPPEEGAVSHGALSYFLMREMAKPGRRSYRDLFEAVAPLVTAYKGQHPQIEGRVDGEVLGVGVLPPMAYVRVTGPSKNGADLDAGGVVELAAGAAQRVTVGSEYDVYRPGAAQPSDADRVARVRVTKVHAVYAEAEPLGGASTDAIKVNARAVEAVHAYGDLRLRAWVDDTVTSSALPEAARLRELLAQSRKVQVVAAAAGAGVRVTLLTPGNTGAVPRLAGVDGPTFAMVDGTGEPVGPLKLAADVEQFAKNLDTYAAWRDTLAIENPDPRSALRGTVTLELLRRVSDAPQPIGFRWDVAGPERPGGDVVFEEGEFIAFRITNHHTEPVFVNLLDLSVDGEVAVLYPRKVDAVEQVGTERAFNVWRKSGEGFGVLFPESYPFVPGDRAAEPVDVVKLFVTTREARFESVAQAAMRSAEAPSAVQALLRGAFAGSERTIDTADDEDAALTATVAEEDWTTVQARFVTRRQGTPAADTAPAAATVPNVDAPAAAAPPAGLGAALGVGGATRDAAERALGGAGLAVQQRFEIVERPAGDGQRDLPAERRVDVAAPAEGFGQMVLTTDADGVVSWHFAAEGATPEGATPDGGRAAGADGVRSYTIPASAPASGTAPAEAGERGLVSAGVRKLVEVVVFPLVEDAVGPIGAQYVERWETKHRPYRLRTFTPDDYDRPEGAAVSGETLAAGRALLMVHGTFSRAHSAFGALSRDVVARLHALYGGRVFGFDHFTLSHDPEQNVRWLLDQLPAGATLDVDVVCHSRGGLVSRVLAERHDDRARVGKVVFVGAPNAGTTLADADRVGKFIDTYTNLLSVVPTNGVTDVLEGIVTVAKVLAVGVAKALPGLQAMRPGGDLLARTLNAAGGAAPANGARYYALSSNYDPRPSTPGLNAMLVNRLMDKVFDAENDLVVPTASTYAANGSALFPIAESVVFRGDESLAHTEFFGRPAVHERLLAWLGA